MFGAAAGVRVFIRPGRTDMRRAINGLSAMAQETLRQDAFSGNLFAFCGRRRDVIKIVYWDRNGFCLWQKRLERDRFVWPKTEGEALELSAQELSWLLAGLDWRKAHPAVKYSVLA